MLPASLIIFLLCFVASAVLVSASEPKPLSRGGKRTDGTAFPTKNSATPYEQTEPMIASIMLEMAAIVPGKSVFVDLGAGDGSLCIAAAKRGAARCVGIERRYDLVSLARKNAEKAGFAEDRVFFIAGDLETANFSYFFQRDGDAVVLMYLLPSVVAALAPKLFLLAPGSRLVSHDYAFPPLMWPEQRAVEVQSKDKARITHQQRSIVYSYVVGRHGNSNFEDAAGIGWNGSVFFDFPSPKDDGDDPFYHGSKYRGAMLSVSKIVRIRNTRQPADDTAAENIENLTRALLYVNKKGRRPGVVRDYYFTVTLTVRRGAIFYVWFQPFRNVDMLREDSIPDFETRVVRIESCGDETVMDWTRRRKLTRAGLTQPAPGTKAEDVLDETQSIEDRPTLFTFDEMEAVPARLRVETRLYDEASRQGKKKRLGDDGDL
jgi:predicted O-methyltransferase YrrM